MNIRIEAPPVDTPRRGKNKSYKHLFDAIRAANGDWVAVDANEVAGMSAPYKRTTLKAASKWWRVNTEIAVTDTTVYIRAIEAPVETGVNHGS